MLRVMRHTSCVGRLPYSARLPSPKVGRGAGGEGVPLPPTPSPCYDEKPTDESVGFVAGSGG